MVTNGIMRPVGRDKKELARGYPLAPQVTCGAMLASLCPTALAEDGSISYLDETGTEQSCETYRAANDTEWKGGWYVAENSVEITNRVTVTGDVHLILTNGCKLDAMSGIDVSKGNSLTIYAQSKDESMGKLETVSDYNGAGIGGEGGAGTISGGVVRVQSSEGADIGGGFDAPNGSIALSDKIEISKDADVKGFGGDKPNLGPPHGAKTDGWVSDSTGHWHPCKIESYAEQFDKDAHSFGDWTIAPPATSTTAGSKHKECTVCGCARRRSRPSPPPAAAATLRPPTSPT